MNRILGILAVALLAFGLAACNGEEDGDGGGGGGSSGPEISVSRGAVTLTDGGADTLGSTPFGTPQTLSYSINNTGGAALNLTGTPVVQTASAVNCSANVTTQATTPVAASGSTGFVISLTVTTAAAFSVQISIANDDSNENPFDFTISGTGATVPEIDVQRPASTSIADGATDNVGGAFVLGANPAITWTIANSGSAVLTLSGGPNFVTTNNLSNCTVAVTQPASATMAASSSQTFQITITVTAAGAFSFQFHISSDDADESPYDVTVSGSVPIPAPEIDVQRPAGTSIADGGGDNVGSTFSVGPQTPITWTIANTGTAALALTGATPVTTANTVNCTVVVTQPAVASVPAAGSTTFQITITTLSAAAFSFDMDVASNDADENPYDIAVSGTAIAGAAEIDVFTLNAAITTPSTTSMGIIAQNQILGVPIMIRNTGASALGITGAVSLTPTNCTAVVRDVPPASIAAGDTGAFVVVVTAGTSGNPSLILSIPNTDSNENPFLFTLTWTLNTPTRVIYTSSGAFTSLVQANTSGAGAPAAINPAVTTGSGVGSYFHLVDRALFTCQTTSPGDTDLFLKGLGASLPATATNLTSTLSTAAGFFGQILFTSGDNIVFTYNTGTGPTRLYSMTITGAAAGAPVEISGTVPSGSPTGVQMVLVSPRKDMVLFVGDFLTAGTQEIFMVPVGGGTRTRLNGSLTGRTLSTASIKWMPDQSGIVYETADFTTGQQREINFSTAVAVPVITRLNGVVPAGRNGVISNTARLSNTGTHIFYKSDEASATGQQEVYVVSRIGGALSAQAGLNGATVPGTAGVGNFGINNAGTKVLFTADSGTAGRPSLFYTTIAGSTPTTITVINSTTNTGVQLEGDKCIVGENTAWYLRDVSFNNSPELFFLDLSVASPTSTVILSTATFPVGATGRGIQAIANVYPQADARVYFVSDQGTFSGSGPRGNLFSATLSATPGGARLNNLPQDASIGTIMILGNTIAFGGQNGAAPDRIFANVFGGGAEVLVNGAEVVGGTGGVTAMLSADRIYYIAYDGGFNASQYNANASGSITQARTDSAGLPVNTGSLKIGTEPR